MDYKKGDIIELEITKLETKGKGIGRIDNLVVFVYGGIPGETIKAEITKIKKSYLEAEKTEVIKESEHKIEPKCPWFDLCGGCKYQNMDYEAQLSWKTQHIFDCLSRLGGFRDISIEKIIKSPEIFYYRNKIELSFLKDDEGKTNIGFHKRNEFDKVVTIKECLIFDERLPKILEIFRKHVDANKMTFFDLKEDPYGFLQYLVVRKSVFSGEIQMNLITRKGDIPKQDDLISKLSEALDNFSFFHTVNYGGVGYAHHGDKKIEKIHGNDFMIEKLDDYKFQISPFAFFQTNTLGAEVLYKTVREFADLQGEDRVLDLYCGAGTISQFVAKDAKEVIGIELINEAIDSAKENATLNQIENCEYIQGDARKVLKFERRKFQDFNLIITDPPRSGMVPKALRRMIGLNAKKIIYVSCNPAMLARDLKEIVEAGYMIQKVQPVDMFPHTFHVETVVLLTKI